jgi:hypothetical protein
LMSAGNLKAAKYVALIWHLDCVRRDGLAGTWGVLFVTGFVARRSALLGVIAVIVMLLAFVPTQSLAKGGGEATCSSHCDESPRRPTSGRAAMKYTVVLLVVIFAVTVLAAPLIADAERVEKIARVGVLGLGREVPKERPYVDLLLQGMREFGWVEGQNMVVERRAGVVSLLMWKFMASPR